jgi:hypothetical protein
MNSIEVYVEIGSKKIFAGAVDWSGFTRSGRDEKSAIQTLVDYGSRYAIALALNGIEFIPPIQPENLNVIERHTGNATTDFGAPAVILDADREPLSQKEFERLKGILQACWEAFDNALSRATGRTLRKGPRGGGRELEMIVEHVVGADVAYLGRLPWKSPKLDQTNSSEAIGIIRQIILEALEAGVNGRLPGQGPRGGSVWPLRYFIRRVAWHALDHAWEIEDRTL